jgi:hypothetical protein
MSSLVRTVKRVMLVMQRMVRRSRSKRQAAEAKLPDDATTMIAAVAVAVAVSLDLS